MDYQKVFDDAHAVERAEEMKTSEQSMLGELVILLATVSNDELPVVFDDGVWWPVDLDSWRGSYCELALSYTKEEEKWTVACVLKMLKDALGETFQGYKGGDYLMGKNTPVWVASYGSSHGFDRNDNGDYQAVVGVDIREDAVVIITELMAF